MRVLKLYFLFALVWFSPKAFSQTLVIENIFYKQSFYLRPGAQVWVQTLDDAEATYTEAHYVSFDGTNMHFTRGFGRKRREISVPLKHISNMYIPKNGKFFGKVILFGLGTILFSSGIAVAIEYPAVGSLMIVESLPLYMQCIVISTKQRIYIPNYDIYSNNSK